MGSSCGMEQMNQSLHFNLVLQKPWNPEKSGAVAKLASNFVNFLSKIPKMLMYKFQEWSSIIAGSDFITSDKDAICTEYQLMFTWPDLKSGCWKYSATRRSTSFSVRVSRFSFPSRILHSNRRHGYPGRIITLSVSPTGIDWDMCQQLELPVWSTSWEKSNRNHLVARILSQKLRRNYSV